MATEATPTQAVPAPPPKSNRLLILIVAAIFFVAIFIFWPCAVGDQWSKELESLFSGWAFIGLIAAVFLQSEELRMQQYELKQTTLALQRAATAQEASENALKNQIRAMRQASLVDGYAAILQAYDRTGQDNGRQIERARDALKNLKQLVRMLDSLEARPPHDDEWEKDALQ
jgi:hypothetical protein